MNPSWCAPLPFRLNLDLQVTREASGSWPAIPVELPDFPLPSAQGRVAAPESLRIVRYDPDSGRPVIFDAARPGDDAFALPLRFMPDPERGEALPLHSARGRLVFLAAPAPRRQCYSLYFALHAAQSAPTYGGLLGDGDIFTQRQGRLTVPGSARPVYYGSALFGRKGLLVAAAHPTGIFFFEDRAADDAPEPDLVLRGRLRDRAGRIIHGIPTLADLDEDGRLDLVVGMPDGTLQQYRNTGSGEMPVFEGPEPLRYAGNGRPIDLRSYVRDQTRIVRLPDGRPNPRYPAMPVLVHHGGRVRVDTTPHFVDWSAAGRKDLLVGVTGEFLVHFERTAHGFRRGVLLRDETGEVVRRGIAPAAADWNADGRPDLFCGDVPGGPVYCLENRGLDRGVPVLGDRGRLAGVGGVEYAFPLPATLHGAPVLLVGNYYGEVACHRLRGGAAGSPPTVESRAGGHYLRMDQAPISRYMPVAQYADLDGDGRPDLVSGDIKGGVFFYRNLATARNPLFEEARPLQTPAGPVRIVGGPDPNTPDDGYSKVALCDLQGAGRPDLLVGTGLGPVVRFAHRGTDAQGAPLFAAGAVLQDSRGNPVRCHHMSAPLVTDWDGDGVPDLLVGGQTAVHAHPDDDPDPESQVRWYRGVRREGRLAFEPYVPLEIEGDRLFCNRPFPQAVSVRDGTRILELAWMLVRQADPLHPERVEFLREFLPRLVHGREAVTMAYHSTAELAPGDRLVVQGSCVGALYAFREAFLENHGYLAATARMLSLEARDRILPPPRHRRWIATPPRALQAPPARIGRTIPVGRIAAAGNPFEDPALLQAVSADTAFRDAAGRPLPERLRPAVQVADDGEALCFLVRCNEPAMERLICRALHPNGPVDGSDDHVALFLDPGADPEFLFRWDINAAGFAKEVRIRRSTGELVGPWRVGAPVPIAVSTRRDPGGWSLWCRIPYAKLGGAPAPGARWRCDLWRYRSLFASATPAFEQRVTGLFRWSGGANRRVTLAFQRGPDR